MSLHIGGQVMTSEITAHWAVQIPGRPGYWLVSWLAGRVLDRNQAITAMTLAETVTTHPTPDERSRWVYGGWAEELGVPLVQAQASILAHPPAMPTMATGRDDGEHADVREQPHHNNNSTEDRNG
jgi:hypothetical protein